VWPSLRALVNEITCLVLAEREPQPPPIRCVPVVGVLTVEEHAAGVRQAEDAQPLREAQPHSALPKPYASPAKAVAADAAHRLRAAEIGRLVERVQAEELFRSQAESEAWLRGDRNRNVERRIAVHLTETSRGRSTARG
jgi:hypothetical protein